MSTVISARDIEPWRRRPFLSAYTAVDAARYAKTAPQTVSYGHSGEVFLARHSLAGSIADSCPALNLLRQLLLQHFEGLACYSKAFARRENIQPKSVCSLLAGRLPDVGQPTRYPRTPMSFRAAGEESLLVYTGRFRGSTRDRRIIHADLPSAPRRIKTLPPHSNSLPEGREDCLTPIL